MRCIRLAGCACIVSCANTHGHVMKVDATSLTRPRFMLRPMFVRLAKVELSCDCSYPMQRHMMMYNNCMEEQFLYTKYGMRPSGQIRRRYYKGNHQSRWSVTVQAQTDCPSYPRGTPCVKQGAKGGPDPEKPQENNKLGLPTQLPEQPRTTRGVAKPTPQDTNTRRNLWSPCCADAVRIVHG